VSGGDEEISLLSRLSRHSLTGRGKARPPRPKKGEGAAWSDRGRFFRRGLEEETLCPALRKVSSEDQVFFVALPFLPLSRRSPTKERLSARQETQGEERKRRGKVRGVQEKERKNRTYRVGVDARRFPPPHPSMVSSVLRQTWLSPSLLPPP
jgi:hypothetical protein